jgi:hypothetical protein
MRTHRASPRIALCILLVLPFVSFQVLRAEDAAASLKLAPHLDTLLKIIQGKRDTFTLQVDGKIPGKEDKITLKIGRSGARGFYLNVDGPKDVKGSLVYSGESMFIELPAKNVAFVAEGASPAGADALKVESLIKEALRLHPVAETLWPVVQNADGRGLAGAIHPLLNAGLTEKAKAESGVDYITLNPQGTKLAIDLTLRVGSWKAQWKDAKDTDNAVEITISENCELPVLNTERKKVVVARAEMERALQRGGLRIIDIKVDDFHGKLPADGVKEAAGARLEIKDGQRTCWLTGSPLEMGRQHGQLMKEEIRKVTDSTLYVVGTVYSVGKGSWFLNDIRDAWKRLEPHCDKEYLDELKGLSEGCEIAYEEMKLANIFPELFHCSGFAISGDATVGGKLFHGRILDYMTEIGLQKAQVDFITKKDGCRGYVNIGYAGFIGCVSGMNDAQVSIGEMGGRGEGNWDGTPMAFLMRRVMEKAENLKQAQDIFSNAKRTCEYYYVIADGKDRSAVGVAAWPEKIEFIKQGEKHERLPDSLPSCVLLSAGERYKLLCQRAKEGFGKLDEQGAIDLMARPVAMGSNLHSVLFVPEDQNYWVAHASINGAKPAATQKYVKHSLKENLVRLDDVKTAKTANK